MRDGARGIEKEREKTRDRGRKGEIGSRQELFTYISERAPGTKR